jgi:hypothetical protein
LVDLPTLQSILTDFGIKSTKLSTCFKELYNKLTISIIIQVFESVFELQVKAAFERLSGKHSSCLSRELVTVVLDDSIFKQWLSSFQLGKTFASCFSCFFSGQFNSTVYGFKNCCIGVVIDGVYYPLYFDYIPKKKKEGDAQYGVQIATAIKLVKRLGTFKQHLKDKGIDLGKLRFSADSGYSDMHLADVCKENDLIYISVPKKSHTFLIDGKSMKLSEWITTEFLRLEEEYNIAQKDVPKSEQKPFFYRFRGFYKSKKRSVVLVAFRLNGSKKVSIIYTTSTDEKAKTLRRHCLPRNLGGFQRTYNEQFFKLLKHVLKIQENRTNTKDAMSFKFLRFAFMAFHVQKLVRFIRKSIPEFRRKGFISVQRIIRRQEYFLDLLQNAISSIF